jgi:hypothetical protein
MAAGAKARATIADTRMKGFIMDCLLKSDVGNRHLFK